MNDTKNDFFGTILSKEKKKIGNKTIYNIEPEYGNGKVIIYKIIQGMYLFYNDLEINNTIINEMYKEFPSPVIKIDYCIDGSYINNCSCNKKCTVNKGSSIYYAGTENFIELDFKGKRYQSISIFCYLDEISNSIEQLLGVSKEKLEEYYTKLIHRKNFLIIETDIEILYMVNEIYKYIKCNNVQLIKIRTLELFLLEINNYEQYKNKNKKYYKKSTIDKIESIRIFIEENMQEHITIEDLSNRFDISSTELKDCFKYVNGIGPYTYLINYRMQVASELLVNKDYNILQIANMIGYSNHSKFSASFKKTFGITPLKYRKMQ